LAHGALKHLGSSSCRQVVVTRVIPGTTTEKELARFGVGDFFGENALIENKPRDATVTAGTQRLNAAVNARLPHRNTPMRALTRCGLGLVRLSDAVADAVATLLHVAWSALRVFMLQWRTRRACALSALHSRSFWGRSKRSKRSTPSGHARCVSVTAHQ
jgi:hypothetical protein